MHPDPERLFEQADELIDGYKNETDLRRAISTAYYGVFHFILRHVADTIAGTGNRSTNLYGMVYRSVEHKPLRDLCATLGSKVKSYAPMGGFGPVIAFAGLVQQLYEQRILADYVPVHSLISAGRRLLWVMGERPLNILMQLHRSSVRPL